MRVFWSSNAKRNYFKVVDYLVEIWTFIEVENFQIKLSKLIHQIQENPKFCPQSKFLNLRKCLIDRQIRLFI